MDLVTGGAGYIGSHFIKAYLDRFPESELVAVDNLSQGHAEALSFSPRIHFEKEDIGNTEAMVEILRKYEVKTVIHFAANCYVGESQENPAKYFQNNCVHTLNLFKAMQICGVKQIVFSSTCATYGNPVYSPLDEQHPQNPINVYGSTKLMIEQALRAYSLAQGWSYVALRYFNAAGADESGLIGERHDPETHLIPLILQTALGKRKAIQIYGNDYETPDGTCIRDYIHVNDLASAHIAAIQYLRANPGGEIFNLGSTRGSSVLEVINTCQSVTGREIHVDYSARRAGDPPMLVANAEKAQRLLGWTTQYDLRKIVETAWQWEQHPQFPSGR
ncbi:UDP-glucose 4-epimerase GalE [Vampirovibrio chlorellavorus]|uniref:UDP-glucose 4-epimerase GalE n=1 Tax=Vampirovibrio chlorellavorus TaxID=758823 RepID=UPI0026F0C274|nr:UDP-glucose 4-epimerase GalE [Vampirovibrio chlorellavorus]